jgi:hypothetical protein
MIIKSVLARKLAPAVAEVYNPHMNIFHMLVEALNVELLATMVPSALGTHALFPVNSVNFM